ncbi:MAG: septal ring lytic transglycosylase RlpA family protein [Bacteroidia bacterium]|nr:septal ring lytic transglycosylase RlpA family protein [Bacteroidia bacterium]MDW8089417.1 septal ring lytic transglycosylase RlpA family protein [Bacteroidia bacterium]
MRWRLGLVWIISGGWGQLKLIEEGEASYYGAEFHGRRTASGEIYHRDSLTAAHRYLPFGTYVRVIGKATGHSVVVRINDRGPHRRGRIIDLSEAAARAIGLIRAGVGPVRLEVLQFPLMEEVAFEAPFCDLAGNPIQPPPYAVQVGAFTEAHNARLLALNLEREIEQKVFIWRVRLHGRPVYRVLVGRFSSRAEADQLRRRLWTKGWRTFVVHLPT